MDSKKIGVSVAASWAWGTGFIVGMGTMQEKGLIPFLIWGVFKQMGIIELWGQIGVIRVAICVSILIAGIITYKSEKCQKM